MPGRQDRPASNIAIFGAGYVGLVTGACLAEIGHQVILVDRDAERIESLERGEPGIYEPGLEELLTKNLDAGRLAITQDATKAIESSEFVFIAVGTPSNESGAADLRSVDAVVRSIGSVVTKPTTIVMKSTVPVGTCDHVSELLSSQVADRGLEIACTVVSNPEFLKEGDAVRDFMEPDRIIIGASNTAALEQMKLLYQHFSDQGAAIIEMDARSSEISKYAANAMLAARISFMNELSLLTSHAGADIELIRLGIGSDPRIGPQFLRAGAGYGGSCFPKDVKALINTFEESGLTADLLRSIESVNDRQKRHMAALVVNALGGVAAGRKVAVWGLAFKPETDDVRDAVSIPLIRQLAIAGAQVRAYDPIAARNAGRLLDDLSNVSIVDDMYDALVDAEVLVLLTEWEQFRSPDFGRIKAAMSGSSLIDGRNLWDRSVLEGLGFDHICIGRGQRPSPAS